MSVFLALPKRKRYYDTNARTIEFNQHTYFKVPWMLDRNKKIHTKACHLINNIWTRIMRTTFEK